MVVSLMVFETNFFYFNPVVVMLENVIPVVSIVISLYYVICYINIMCLIIFQNISLWGGIDKNLLWLESKNGMIIIFSSI